MNKYNVQAIRNELENYITNTKWESFRNRFQNLNDELAHAVVMKTYQKKKKKKMSSSKPLLILMLCYHNRGGNNNNKPFTMDVLELVIQASSPEILYKSNPTPLAIAMEYAAPVAILEILLKYDTTKQSLYVSDRRHGNTPLLYAIRHELDDRVVCLLIQSDHSTRQSLLLRTKRRNRSPLYYKANEEFSIMSRDIVYLTSDFQYVLLQTYIALTYENDNIAEFLSLLNDDKTATSCNSSDHSQNGFFEYHNNNNDNHNTNTDHWNKLLKATIATAHLLGTKNTVKLLAFLTPKVLVHYSDDNETTLLHHVCCAKEERPFIEPNITLPPSTTTTATTATSLVKALCMVNPRILLTPNTQGKLPFHLAIENKKSWELLKHISSPDVCRIAFDGSLPLHMAIQQYSNDDSDDTEDSIIIELWKLYPEAALVADERTQLLPYQLAASVEKNCRDSSYSDNNDILSIIYFLLRSFPQVLNQYVESKNC